MIKKILSFITLFLIVGTVVAEDYFDERFNQLSSSSDIMWCDEDMCTLYRSKEVIWREEDMPLGFMILVNDDSFTREEIERYANQLMSHWAHVLEE